MILGAFILLSISAAAFIVAANALGARADDPLNHRRNNDSYSSGIRREGFIQHGSHPDA